MHEWRPQMKEAGERRVSCLPASSANLRAWRYLTVTLSIAVVQQQTSPPPPGPEKSLPTTCRMYSPGSLNFAVTLVLPAYGCATCPPEMVSTFGLPSAGSKVTVPGPRYFEKI